MSQLQVVELFDSLKGALMKPPAALKGVPRFHQSMCKTLLNECPAALKWQLDNGGFRKPTRGMEKGSLVHQLVLGGYQFHTMQAKLASGPNKGQRATNFQCKAAQEEADDVRSRGFIPVFAHELEELEALAANVRTALVMAGVELDKCERELTHQWTSPDGIECEGTPDFRFVRPVIDTFDLKVGYTANPDIWDKKLYDDGADIQAAAYEEQAHEQYGNVPTRHFIVAAETEAWCPVSIMQVSETYLEIGRKRWARAKRIWRACWESGEWPEYSTRPLTPPNHIVQREEFAQ